eukprot:scaffold59033_cov45-Phaeocystis_antarctica.AAC.1
MTPSTLTSAAQASNPGLADGVPGRSATHTCEPCLGQGGGSIDFNELNKALKRRAPMHGCGTWLGSGLGLGSGLDKALKRRAPMHGCGTLLGSGLGLGS